MFTGSWERKGSTAFATRRPAATSGAAMNAGRKPHPRPRELGSELGGQVRNRERVLSRQQADRARCQATRSVGSNHRAESGDLRLAQGLGRLRKRMRRRDREDHRGLCHDAQTIAATRRWISGRAQTRDRRALRPAHPKCRPGPRAKISIACARRHERDIRHRTLRPEGIRARTGRAYPRLYATRSPNPVATRWTRLSTSPAASSRRRPSSSSRRPAGVSRARCPRRSNRRTSRSSSSLRTV